MLSLQDVRVYQTKFENVLPGAAINEEGVVLVYAKDGDGNTVVQPSTGADGEVFAGVAYHRSAPPAAVPMFQEFVVDSSNQVQLARAPIADELFAKLGTTPMSVVSGAPSSSNEVKVDDDKLKFTGSAGKAGTVQYMYAPTVEEAITFMGNLPVGGLGIAETGVVGVLKNGEFGTSFFDASVDWSSAFFVKTGPNGKFVAGTADDHIPNVIVKRIPGSGSPFLSVQINVA